METTNSNFNGFDEMNELEDLRQQIKALKEKVDQQGRLNEELVKKAIQGKMKGLQRTLLRYYLVLGIFVPFILWNFIKSGFTPLFIIFTFLIFAGSFTADYLINRINIRQMTDDLMETAHKLMEMKKNRKTQLTVGLCGLAIWIPWYFYEIYKSAQPVVGEADMGAFMTMVAIGMFVGCAIGGAIGLYFYRKLQRTNDEMLNQINELTREQ